MLRAFSAVTLIAAFALDSLAAQDIGTTDLVAGLSNPSRWADPLRRLQQQAAQPAHADHAGQRSSARAALDVSDRPRHRRHHEFEATPIVVDGMLYITGVNNTRGRSTAEPGRRSGATSGRCPPGLKVCCGPVNRGFAIYPRSPVHDDARRARDRARREDRQARVGRAAHRLRARLLQHRRPARRQGQADRRAWPAASSRRADSSTPTASTTASASGASGRFPRRASPAATRWPPGHFERGGGAHVDHRLVRS